MILTKAEAGAVYRAMCELNNVSALLHARMLRRDNTTTHVKEYTTDEISVWVGDVHGNPVDHKVERHAGQDAFKKAYRL